MQWGRALLGRAHGLHVLHERVRQGSGMISVLNSSLTRPRFNAARNQTVDIRKTPANEVPNIFADLATHADSQRHFGSAALARAVFKPKPWITAIWNLRIGTPNVGSANRGLHWSDVDTGSGV